MKLKCKHIAAAVFGMFLTSCYEDKGNYEYSEIEVIEVTIPEGLSIMEKAENVKFSPMVVSSITGEISADNPNYEFGCKLYNPHYNEKNERVYWEDINPEKKKDIDFATKASAGNHQIWYTVINKETGVTSNFQSSLRVISSTSEGWMVLSNVGAEKKVRLDMIFQDSKDETRIAVDVLGDEAPVITEGTQLVMCPSQASGREAIYLLSRSGGYRLNLDKLTTTADNDMKYTDFVLATTQGNPISVLVVNNGESFRQSSLVCVTDIGDAYGIHNSNAGSAFESLLNTDKGGNDATFKVSPFTGTSFSRVKDVGGNSSCALLFDETNKRFVGWDCNPEDDKVLLSLVEPQGTDRKFSWNIGMDIVDMESTRFSDGMVYAVVEDAQKKRHVCAVNLSGSRFSQAEYYTGISAEHFNDAVDYAFHSQFSFVFYAYGNKVYSYNLGTRSMNHVFDLPAGESVTKLKFNLYLQPSPSNLSNQSEEFMAKQYDLIVGSTTGADDGGVVRFIDIDVDGKMTQISEHKGFGDVVDVTYRERRQ